LVGDCGETFRLDGKNDRFAGRHGGADGMDGDLIVGGGNSDCANNQFRSSAMDPASRASASRSENTRRHNRCVPIANQRQEETLLVRHTFACMSREMLQHLQKKKFRLLVRWKVMLKARASFRVPRLDRFPHALIFRTFDEILRLMRLAAAGAPLDVRQGNLAAHLADRLPSADQYMEILLAGRDVVEEFLGKDTAFCIRFDEDVRDALRVSLAQVIRHLVDREMREFFRRSGKALDAESARQRATPVSCRPAMRSRAARGQTESARIASSVAADRWRLSEAPCSISMAIGQ
jgi:hypothetical protein